MALLVRNADRIYWAARYLERGEDTARLVQEFGELFDDMPSDDPDENAFRWAPLLAVCGDRSMLVKEASEREVVDLLVCDPEEDGSVAFCVSADRKSVV